MNNIVLIITLIVISITCLWLIFDYLPNASAPKLHRKAIVTGKRVHVVGGPRHTSTYYYVTFQFKDQHRAEFKVNARIYSYLAEGDRGTLHSQGKWFQKFYREKSANQYSVSQNSY